MTRLFIECACNTEALEFLYAAPQKVDCWPSGEMWVSLWKQGYEDPKTLSIWKRIGLAFEVLRHGTLFADQVILNKDKVVELKDWLNSLEMAE